VLERQGVSDTLIATGLSQLSRSTLEAIAPGSLLNKFVPLTYKGIIYFCYRKFSVAFCDSNVCTTLLSEKEWLNKMQPEDFRGLTPLFYSHVNPYGRLFLNMLERIIIE
jgi:hypothetical protein